MQKLLMVALEDNLSVIEICQGSRTFLCTDAGHNLLRLILLLT